MDMSTCRTITPHNTTAFLRCEKHARAAEQRFGAVQNNDWSIDQWETWWGREFDRQLSEEEKCAGLKLGRTA